MGDPVVFTEDDGDPSIEIRIVATDGFIGIFDDTEKSRIGRDWD